MAQGGGGGPGLRSVRNLCLLQLADALMLLVCGVVAASIHGEVDPGRPTYYSGAFIAMFLLTAIAGIGFLVHRRSKKCISVQEVAFRIATLMKAYCVCLVLSWPGWFAAMMVTEISGVCRTSGCSYSMKAYCVCLVLSWPGWFAAMMVTGISGVCRTSGCSYSENSDGNFALAIIIIVCIAVAFFANVPCTFLLYIYCSNMGLTLYGTRRIQVDDVISASGSPKFSRVTATTEVQTLPALMAAAETATAQCQTQSTFSVHESAFRPIKSEPLTEPANPEDASNQVWAIPSDNAPVEAKQKSKKGRKTKGNKKKKKVDKYKNSDLNLDQNGSLDNQDISSAHPTSAVHIDSFGSVDHPLASASPPPRFYRRHTHQSPPPIHSPDYLHVQLPNAPLPIDQDPSVSYQVSYLPFARTDRSASPSTNLIPIRIPTATPPAQLSPPPTPSFRTTAWQDYAGSSGSGSGSGSSSPVRCKTPQPPSSFSSESSRSYTGDPYLPTLQSRYNPTPPPAVLSPRGRGMLYTDAFDDEEI